jgi:hypothetical protein
MLLTVRSLLPPAHPMTRVRSSDDRMNAITGTHS